MRKILNTVEQSQLEPIIVKINPKELRNGIVMPKIKYEIVATIEHEEAFSGMVLPIPKVLIYFLNNNELKVVSTIIEETNETGECALTVREIAIKMQLSPPTVSGALYSLRKMGLLVEISNGERGNGKIRTLNYATVQHLNDLVEGEDPGIYSRIRKATRKTVILNLTREDVVKAYDRYVLPPDHDPEEEEEYD